MRLVVRCKKCRAYIHLINQRHCCGTDYWALAQMAVQEAQRQQEVEKPVKEEQEQPPKKKKKGKYKGKRKHIYQNEIRPAVLERDNYACVKCGATEYLEVHHKIHRKDGGSDAMHNLRTVCDICHAEEHRGEPVYNLMMKRARERRS